MYHHGNSFLIVVVSSPMASIDFLKALHDMVKGGNGDVDLALRKLNKDRKRIERFTCIYYLLLSLLTFSQRVM